MALQDKYRQLISTAQQAGVSNLQVREQGGVLYIDGTAPSAAVKDQLWNVYEQIDPYFIYFSQEGSPYNGTLKVQPKQVSLFPILPSVTWNFRF